MKKSILFLLALSISMFTTQFSFAAESMMIEEAIESTALRIKISRDLNGVVTGKVCQRCELKVVKITPATKLFIDGKPADLSRAASVSGKPGTAVFNIKTQLVTKIYSHQ